ncbi:hypothetical protein BJX63DRAFT_393349 [Aspergillus granulosus]|uniref:NFX1-type zinc finger-containing protein 1 n=1 Tax=Aspergillus granulosus TaxID=176169 RepID=A0ABR4HEZ5_9EURO
MPPSRPRGRGNGRSRRPHNQDNVTRKGLCRLFAQGQCGYGEGCRYRHEGPSPSTDSRERTALTAEESAEQEEYRDWKRRLKRAPFASSTHQMKAIMDGALEILANKNQSLRQQIPRDLVDQDDTTGTKGLQWIREIMNVRISQRFLASDILLVARSFLKLITHPKLLDCLSVDTYMGDLYAFICGSSGARAIPFFQHVCKALESPEASDNDADEVIMCLVRAIREVMVRNQKALYHEGLPGLIDSIAKLCDRCIVTTNMPQMARTRIQIEALQRLRQRADTILADNNDETEIDIAGALQKTVRPDYRVLETPSARHNNDKADISQIKIVPTEDEIRCEKEELLPSTNFDSPYFLQGAERLIDVHFRLLRHDIFDEATKTIAEILHVHDRRLDLGQWLRSSESNRAIRAYSDASVDHLAFTKQRGLEIDISMMEPPRLTHQKNAQKQKWWNDTRRLDEGCLLCLVWFHNRASSIVFLTVSQKSVAVKERGSLVPNKGRRATITTSLIPGQANHDLEALVRRHHERNGGQNILIEFPSILFATFAPILENMQRMYNESYLPFSTWIVPNSQRDTDGGSISDIPPPVYARDPGFSFHLNAILSDKLATLSLTPTNVASDLHSQLKALTSLDEGQCDALISALSREFCLIQGPPGTGKSYLGVQLMRVLVANKARANLGPIVVVCYTNHALDQFLEHLVDEGINKIVRIGSKSSEAMEGKNLKVIARGVAKTRGENYTLGTRHSRREDKEKSLKKKIGALQALNRRSWGGFDYHLRKLYPEIHKQFSGEDADGFVTQEKIPDRFKRWIRGSTQGKVSNYSLEEPRNVIDKAKRNIWDLSGKDRNTLLSQLLQEVRERIIDEILDDFREDDALAKQIRDVYDEVDRRALENADVIGVTTSGLARRISVLRHIDCRVVICEEAGEVLEAHMLSALIPSVQHLIQIGDHQQLRPQIVNHKLSMESHSGSLYQLDRSQFERMALGEPGLPAFPTSQLNVQRRMRPEVSTLIRNTLYERLVDHDSVKDLPGVVGMGKNVFWLDHENQEDAVDQEFRGRSKSNTWEVRMTHALVRHIVRQGVYESKDIAVLTPYVGQLLKLRSALQTDFEIVLSDRDQETLMKEGHEDSDDLSHTHLQKKSMTELLRIATVDNFQGEEAKVIIISLVRSNNERKVGFLKTSNRINVLLSRAKHGMYLIGNSKTYANVPMWSNVLGMLRMADSIGPKFSLHCDRHSETDAMVATPEDFEILSPQGGCRKQCDQRLPRCGHQCRSKCHSDALHKAFNCPLPCARLFHPCEHGCPELCGEPCGLCKTVLHNIQLPCGHVKDRLQCHQAQDPKSVECRVAVKKSVPSCGHVVTVPCFEDVYSESFKCSEPCQEVLSCGHTCSGTCHSCAPRPQKESGPKEAMHHKCKVICGRKQGSCYHTCPRKCHSGSDCGVCQAKCEVRCAHSKCPKSCHEACPPCVERCTWGCEHQGQCGLPCAAPCNRLPCSKRCTKTLHCGHQCPSLCGERCPESYCQVCSNKGDARVDMLEFKSYSEIDLDESPIIVLSCRHFFTAETLDGHIGMQDAYKMDKTGEYTALARSTSLSQFVPRCPDCQSPIQQYATQRYNRVINQAVLDETSKRFIISGNQSLAQFDNDIQELEAGYQRIRANTTAQNKKELEKIEHRSIALAKKIELFIAEVADKEQPIRKLHDATVKAMREAHVDSRMAELSIENHITNLSPDQRIVTGGSVKLFKLHYTVVDNLLQLSKINKSVSVAKTVGAAKSVMSSIETFISDPVSESFPRLIIEVKLYYAKIALLLRSHRGVPSIETETTTCNERAKEYLQQAEKLCAKGFRGANELSSAVKELLKLLREKWYEEVTSKELESIKLAMISGRGGFSTHSGHWYNCENGHPFAVGECGMPMELARCPECGAQVGGQNHRPAEGVSRALQMER